MNMSSETALSLPSRALVVPFILGAAVLATAAPLLAYTVSLAAFGLPHVLAELRYVDLRFKARLTRPLLAALLGLLGVLVISRVAGLVGWSTDTRAPVELLILVGLTVVVLPRLIRGGATATALGAVVILAIGFGCLQAPGVTLVALAILHNLTPVGFLAERLEGARKKRAMAACGVAFVIVPAFLIMGGLRTGLVAIGSWHGDASLFAVGSLSNHLGAFVPGPWLDATWAADLFTAAVYLQMLHYAVVLHVLPRLIDARERQGSVVPWPTPTLFARFLAVVGALTLVAFATSFGDARRAYGVFAAVHAWIEVPVLLLALIPIAGMNRVRTA